MCEREKEKARERESEAGEGADNVSYAFYSEGGNRNRTILCATDKAFIHHTRLTRGGAGGNGRVRVRFGFGVWGSGFWLSGSGIGDRGSGFGFKTCSALLATLGPTRTRIYLGFFFNVTRGTVHKLESRRGTTLTVSGRGG